jgi:hypothetical protein
MKNFFGIAFLFLASLIMPLTASLPAFAATTSGNTEATNGYRLSPVRTDLFVSPGSSKSITLFIQNASGAEENLQVVIDDFEAPANESGDPQLLLNGSQAPNHSLKQFVKVPEPTFTLAPNEQKEITVNVVIPTGTAAGGYYGAVRFAPVGTNGSKNVNLSASIASLVLVTVPGNLVEQVSVTGFGVAQGGSNNPGRFFTSNKNLHAVVQFDNTGNVQEQPFGDILLRKGSKTVVNYKVNDGTPPGNVLPDSIRLFNVKLTKIGVFGKYKVEGNFGYGSKGVLLTAESTFYVIPVALIIAIIVIILLLVLSAFGIPRFIRRYNKRVIERSNKKPRR